MAQRTEGDEASSREERTFRIWLNSLLPADRHVSADLPSDLRDGFVLLSALDAVLPSAVEVSNLAAQKDSCRVCQKPAQQDSNIFSYESLQSVAKLCTCGSSTT